MTMTAKTMTARIVLLLTFLLLSALAPAAEQEMVSSKKPLFIPDRLFRVATSFNGEVRGDFDMRRGTNFQIGETSISSTDMDLNFDVDKFITWVSDNGECGVSLENVDKGIRMELARIPGTMWRVTITRPNPVQKDGAEQVVTYVCIGGFERIFFKSEGEGQYNELIKGAMGVLQRDE